MAEPTFDDLVNAVSEKVTAALKPKEEPKTYGEFWERFSEDFAKSFGVKPNGANEDGKEGESKGGDQEPKPSHPFFKKMFGAEE